MGEFGATGILATHDIDEILALDADCVLYTRAPATSTRCARCSRQV
ncbi:hypothetical protein ACRAWF_21120 [Streptomyces sp. L7]